MRWRTGGGWTAAVALMAACSGGGGGGGNSGTTTPTTPTTPTLVTTTVNVSLSATSVAVGGTATATATPLDQNGNALSGRSVTWSSSSASVATVTASGQVSAVGVGTASIVATIDSKSGQQTITVTAPAPAPVATVTVTPAAASIVVGATQTLTAATLDASGATLTGRTITWSSSNAAIATVTASGSTTTVTGAAAGTATITATSEGKTATATITVTAAAPAPVATVAVSPATASLTVGGTQILTATTKDASGNTLTGRTITWTSSNTAVATTTATGATATVTATGAGSATITATSEGKTATATITIAAASAACTPATALQLAFGEVRQLTAAQAASLCVGTATATEYVLIPFNNSTVAASTTPVTITSTGTVAATVTPLASFLRSGSLVPDNSALRLAAANAAFETGFRARERRELTPLIAGARNALSASLSSPAGITRGNLTNIGANPTVGSIVSLNANLNASGCAAKVPRPARVVAVGTKSIVLIDTLVPTGGYTNAELTAFGTTFDTLVFPLDTLNFGAPSDIDVNGRVAIFFTPEVNKLTISGGYVGGLQFSRDLFTVAQCPGSNEGEMFYMPVPDPTSSNAGYNNKTNLSNTVITTLMHEFQHLINAGRRIYVNNAAGFEEVWLNEGLSHISEELIYDKVSGQSPRTNIDLTVLRSSQAQLNAVNTYQVQNLSRLISYLQAPDINSPYSLVDGLEMRGAIWQLLRYSADRKAGVDRTLWFNLCNSTTSGQANFNAVMGDITTLTRNWAVAQFLDDASLSNLAIYSSPSWNFRSILPALVTGGAYPLATRALVSPNAVNLSLVGGGAAYLRFRVAGGTPAVVTGVSSGQPLPTNVDFILVRTQ